jgi:exoribonuclease R
MLNASAAATFKGYIVSIKGKGMIVELPDSLQRGMVTFASITSDWLEANEAMTQVKTRGGKVRYTIGDKVEVALTKVDTTRGFIDFVMADQVAAPPRRSKKSKIQPDLKTGNSRHPVKSRRRRRR